jgi:hypothetical protein
MDFSLLKAEYYPVIEDCLTITKTTYRTKQTLTHMLHNKIRGTKTEDA